MPFFRLAFYRARFRRRVHDGKWSRECNGWGMKGACVTHKPLHCKEDPTVVPSVIPENMGAVIALHDAPNPSSGIVAQYVQRGSKTSTLFSQCRAVCTTQLEDIHLGSWKPLSYRLPQYISRLRIVGYIPGYLPESNRKQPGLVPEYPRLYALLETPIVIFPILIASTFIPKTWVRSCRGHCVNRDLPDPPPRRFRAKLMKVRLEALLNATK